MKILPSYQLLVAFIVFVAIDDFSFAQKTAFSFQFGKNAADAKSEVFHEAKAMGRETHSGFDFGTAYRVHMQEEGFTATAPVYFSVQLPEGNYLVTVVLGGRQPSETTVKAESKRLFVKERQLDAGQTEALSFVVNVHNDSISGETKINLKDRETVTLNYDHKLTLEFTGNTAVQSISIKPATVTTVFLAGDSTVTDQDLEPWASWGQFITAYFDDEIAVANYAASGESLSSFKGRRRLDKILSQMKKGDYVFIEFGHNDEKLKGEGMGPWEYFYNTLTEFVTKIREKGGIPVLVTPTQRRAFDGETLKPTHGDYPDAMRKAARDNDVALIDITAMTTKMYEAWGNEGSRNAFVQYAPNTFPGQYYPLEDNTHFNNFGANEIALAVLHGLRQTDLDLKKHIRTDAPTYDPKNPNTLADWSLPYSGRFEALKPDGN